MAILQNGSSSNSASAAAESVVCIGTIVHYCPASDKHFVVFDEEALQPQWITAQKGSCEVLVGAVEGAPSTSPAVQRAQDWRKHAAFDCTMCGVSGCGDDVQMGRLVQCATCNLVCHAYCVPIGSPQPIVEPPKPAHVPVSRRDSGRKDKDQPQAPPDWNCWKCTGTTTVETTFNQLC